MDGITCSECENEIPERGWVQVIVRDSMGDDFVHAVGFMCSSTCLLTYAERVHKEMTV